MAVATGIPFSADALADSAALSRESLLSIAIARGCRHYAPLLPDDVAVIDHPALPHEMLGAALLRGPADAGTFQAIRCGAMVLSDLGNSVVRIRDAANYFGVAHRVAHIARLGLKFDTHPEFWATLLDLIVAHASEAEFLPGVSRFVSETRMSGFGRGPAREWLRTCHLQ